MDAKNNTSKPLSQGAPSGLPEVPAGRLYDAQFKPSGAYTASLPDIHNALEVPVEGADVPIVQVGIGNFRLPLRFLTADNDTQSLEASVTGTVSLKAGVRGINMSRIMRVFYTFKDRPFTLELLEEILIRYKEELGSSRARLKLNFSYPILQKSLRSDHEGFQYYNVSYEGIIDDLGRFQKIIHFDMVYSSACPCSSELSEHARAQRGIYAIPHSQRSKARVSVQVREGAYRTIEDIHAHCLKALKTETQVMVRRQDEQAFAELNGAHEKFVEDAARLVYEALAQDEGIRDFQVVCVHLESLHAHDAVAVITKGVPGGFTGEVEDFRALLC